MAQLREFMFERVYLGPAVRAEHARIASVLRRLFEHYAQHPELLPALAEDGDAGARGVAAAAGDGSSAQLARRVTDYLAGMTDRFCIRRFEALAVPRAFPSSE